MDKQFQNSPKILTNEEEADEIMRRLAAPPKPATRILTARWHVEDLADFGSQHGLDLEKEITDALTASIMQEIDDEMMKDMMRDIKKWTK